MKNCIKEKEKYELKYSRPEPHKIYSKHNILYEVFSCDEV